MSSLAAQKESDGLLAVTWEQMIMQHSMLIIGQRE
jgi:hypothetical protein